MITKLHTHRAIIQKYAARDQEYYNKKADKRSDN